MPSGKSVEAKITDSLEAWCVIETNPTHHGEKQPVREPNYSQTNYEESSSIIRAPKYLQKNYEATKDYFVPQEVSLGPIHFLQKEKAYHSAEIDKSYAVRSLMDRFRSKKLFEPLSKFELSEESDLLKNNEFIVAVDKEIKECSDPHVRAMESKCNYFIMFRDTCFLLACLQEWEEGKKLPNYFHDDIMKLENQIPFSILKSLDKDLNGGSQSNALEDRFSRFASHLLSYPILEEESCRYSVPAFNNLLDCMHQLVLGKLLESSSSPGYVPPVIVAAESGAHQRSGYVRLPVGTESSSGQLQASTGPSSAATDKSSIVQLPSATKLSNAGISIKPLENCKGIVDAGCEHFTPGIRQIFFEESTSTLYLPKVFFGDFTDVIWRNLIAFEIKQKKEAERGVIRFVHLMKDLVDNSKDTDLLTKSGVLESRREDKKVTEFWSKLGGKTTRNPFKPIEDASTAVNEVYAKKNLTILWNEWLARYWSKPWVFTSAAAATILLLLTVVQVVCLFCKCD